MRKAERREQILEAALRAFLEGGYHGTHIDHVVREAGIARGTFYLHFESKHAVFAALVDRMLAIFLQTRAPDRPAARDLAEARSQLTAVYHRVLATFRLHRGLCRLLFDEAVGIDKGFREQLDEHERQWSERVAETLLQLVDAGLARPDLDVRVTAELVVGMVERITRRYLLGDDEPDLDRLVTALVDLELAGVAR